MEPNGFLNDEEVEEEKSSFLKVINAYKQYRSHSFLRLEASRRAVIRLDAKHQRYLKSYLQHLEKVRVAIDHNAEFLKLITADAEKGIFENMPTFSGHEERTEGSNPSDQDIDKVRSTLRQFYREWSSEGQLERDQSFQPLLQMAETLFPGESTDRSKIKVLVPGAGLGRLAFEFATRGFACQGNEFSFYVLSASCFVLNHCTEENMFTIYPFVHQYTNNVCNEDRIRPVRIPDVSPQLAASNGQFTMIAGDFTQIYGKHDVSWNMVVTCFFIDTGPNVIKYLETIYDCLLPGGYWLNLGPLMYHFADQRSHRGIEPSIEDVKQIAQEIGFELVESRDNIHTLYCTNQKSMLQHSYKSSFMVYRKPGHS